MGHFNLIKRAPKRKKMRYRWLSVVIARSLPLSWIEYPDIREFSGEFINISTRSVKSICLQLVKIVEKKISKEIQGSVGRVILHDGWSLSGTHYVSVFGA